MIEESKPKKKRALAAVFQDTIKLIETVLPVGKQRKDAPVLTSGRIYSKLLEELS